MAMNISATDAQARLGAILKWAEEYRDDVIIERRGKPAGVLISFAAYEELERLRQREAARQALAELAALRTEVQARNPDLTAEDAYRLAGFGEEAIRTTLEKDRELADADK